MDFYKNKALWSFIAGAFAVTKGKDMITSQKAKRIYANVLAQGMMVSDGITTAYEDIKEEATDIREEAKSIKEIKLIEGSDA